MHTAGDMPSWMDWRPLGTDNPDADTETLVRIALFYVASFLKRATFTEDRFFVSINFLRVPVEHLRQISGLKSCLFVSGIDYRLTCG